MVVRRILSAVLAVGLVAACSSGDDAGSEDAGGEPSTTSTSTAPPEPAPAVASEFVENECWWDLPDTHPDEVTITCGTVEVPSDPTDPDSEPFTLAVARAHHADSDPDAAPILLLHGGPGGSALGGALNVGDGSLVADRDLITFDQRGSGRSLPSLNCPEKEEAILDALGTADPWEDEYAANRTAVEACYERLTVDEGIDLDLFDTPTSVQDMEVLRETFGVEQWNLWGGSYGTRLGLDYARTHPDRVRSLLIDSVYPPQVNGLERELQRVPTALQRLFDACAEDEACAGLGDLGEQFDQAVAALDAEPEAVTTTVRVGGEDVERDFVVVGSDIGAGMFAAMYQTDLIPAIPTIIADLAAGGRAIIPLYVQTGVPQLVDLSEGAYISIECADSGTAIDDDEREELVADRSGDTLVALTTAMTFCDVWPVEPVDPSFSEVAVPDVPTLVYGGTLDPITPYTDSADQAAAMPDAVYVEVPRGGHGVAAFDECTRAVRAAFWDDPATPLDPCTASIEPVPFAVEAG